MRAGVMLVGIGIVVYGIAMLLPALLSSGFAAAGLFGFVTIMLAGSSVVIVGLGVVIVAQSLPRR